MPKMMRKHNLCRTAEYGSWVAMRRRCSGLNPYDFKNYKGKGITICSRWDSFLNFYNDMGLKPSRLYTLDRKDNNGNYEPENCRWATREDQNFNRNNAIHVEIEGVSKPLKKWALESNISYVTLLKRYNRGIRGSELLLPPNLNYKRR